MAIDIFISEFTVNKKTYLNHWCQGSEDKYYNSTGANCPKVWVAKLVN